MFKLWIIMPTMLLAFTLPTHAVYAPNPAESAPNQADTAQVVARLIYCESGGQNIVILDSNGKYSYGVLMIQLATWFEWQKESGITGEPMNKKDAVKMATWAIQNGYIKHWTEWEYAMGLFDKCKWQR